MEIPIISHEAGVVKKILRQQGKSVSSGQTVLILEI